MAGDVIVCDSYPEAVEHMNKFVMDFELEQAS